MSEPTSELLRRAIVIGHGGKPYMKIEDAIVYLEEFAERQSHATGFEALPAAAALRLAANGLRDLRDG